MIEIQLQRARSEGALRRAHRRSLALLATLAGASSLLLGGCGASSPTKAQYNARASAICHSATTQTAPLVERLTTAVESLSSERQQAARQLSGALAQLHLVASDTLAKLRALKQPAGAHGEIDLFLSSLATVDEILARAATAAATGDTQTALGELQQAGPAAQQMVAAASAYGMARCETLLQGLASAGANAIHASIRGENHEPVVNKPWRYTVSVTDALGHPLSGTETTNYTFGGAVVGTEEPQNVRFTDGVYRDTIEFPSAAVGYPLELQAVVHVSLGTVTLKWPVTVRR